MYQVSDYRDHQSYGPIIAERVWTAWWQKSGVPLADFVRGMDEMADDRPIPVALVAWDDGGYAGSAFVIECDLDERTQYAPWIAALWVEEGKRGQGIATSLLKEATKTVAALGQDIAYLCCRQHLEPFYLALGWTLIERGVGPHDLSVLTFRTANVS